MDLKADPSKIFTCFVIMPFGETDHRDGSQIIRTTGGEWAHIFERWIKKAVESFQPHRFRCIRSPALPGNFIKGIVNDLYGAEIVIADITGSRPNVYYELGIRHALQTGTIIITQDFSAVPSDLKSYYCFQYNYTKEHHLYETRYKEFEAELHLKIAHFFDNFFASDNPVSDFLGYKNAFFEERFLNEKRELTFLVATARDVIKKNYALCGQLVKLGKHVAAGGGPENFEFEETLIFDFFPFDLLFSRFVNTKWELMPLDLIQNLAAFWQHIRYQFLPIHQGWHVLQINPTSEANHNFFELAEATLADRDKAEKALDSLVTEFEKLSYTLTITPNLQQNKA